MHVVLMFVCTHSHQRLLAIHIHNAAAAVRRLAQGSAGGRPLSLWPIQALQGRDAATSLQLPTLKVPCAYCKAL